MNLAKSTNMPSKDREMEAEEKSSERRHRSKSERDPNRPERDPNRPHKSRSSRPKIIDPETGEVKHRKRKDKGSQVSSSSMADLVPELARTASAPGATSRGSLPYPSFNKAFSKEAINSRDDVRLKNPYTPESTDVGEERRRSASADFTGNQGRPPSPPETEFSQHKATQSRMAQVQEELEAESRSSSRSSMRKPRDDGSKLSVRSKGSERDDGSKLSVKSKASEASKASTAKASPWSPRPTVESEIEIIDSGESNVTSVAPGRPSHIETDSSPASLQDSSPRTPTQTPTFPPDIAKAPTPFSNYEPSETESDAYDSPMPPPPPPPPMQPISIPQVDYLMQNGGLLRPVSKGILAATPNFSPNPNTPHRNPMPSEIEKIFGPYFMVLDQYEAVIKKNGSVAVATGYRSVARRLLDRLENVFNRDLSSEGCSCVMCQNPDLRIHEGSRGLGWGEVLEWVSSRRELPTWPAFDFATLGVKAEENAGLGISGHSRGNSDGLRPSSPVKMDPDIGEEFREHYLAVSAKKKLIVNKWLSSCPQTAAAPPQEVDDETLSFAILTHLDQQDRPVFNNLINGSTQPVMRGPNSTRKPRSEFMIRTVHSIQRLYRLQEPPRDPEAAVFLLKNPNIHNLLATMSSINASEWEILTSGRFDGFLWSGAEESMANSPAVSRGPTPVHMDFRSPMSPVGRVQGVSRTTTPFSRTQPMSHIDAMRTSTFSPSMGYVPSRGPTPSQRHPVSNDEETEIQVLAEVEREIYLGMEALEDAFEGLHRKAEVVRRALRERGAGLSMSLQSRRTSQPDIIRSNTPGWGTAQWGGVTFESNKWEGSELSENEYDDEGQSEIAPDDSASNISSSRHRRPKRRNERRTPAPVEEEDEG